MSNSDLTFCKVYIYAKEWPSFNLGALHEPCTHPTLHCTGWTVGTNVFTYKLLNLGLVLATSKDI